MRLIRTKDIVRLRGQQADYMETRRLKAELRRLRKRRRPFYLTGAELNQILLWKFGGRVHGRRNSKSKNPESLVRAITGLALQIRHPDEDYQIELRIRLLTAMRGVSIMVASAILALSFPDEYAVIDFRVWRQLFGRRKYAFTVRDYVKYMRVMRGLARRLGWPVQEVDHAIWEYDRRKSKDTWP